ncbi:UNVERIFIED_CONTAM: hypothetical protein K2H54_065749 [Gekko kuhli]
MEADPVHAVLLAIMAVEAHLQQFKQAARRWAEVVTAGRLQMCTAWALFQVRQRVRAKQRQARKRRCIRNLQILGERLPGRRWWVYPRSSDWWDNFVMHIWGEEKWLENFRMSKYFGKHAVCGRAPLLVQRSQGGGRQGERDATGQKDRPLSKAQFNLGGEGRLRPAQKFPDPNLGSPYTPHLEWFLPAQATMGDRRIYTLGQEECCGGIRSTFNWLVDALRDVLHRRRTEMRAPVSVERRVAVAVWWMANNMSYRAVAHQFGLARSTVAGIVVEVTRAITERLLERVVYLRDPDKDMSWSAIMSGGPCPCPCQLPSARPATPLNWITVAHKRTYPVVVVSSREGSPGEDREPDPAAVMQVVEERLRTVESGMVNIRRTWVLMSFPTQTLQRVLC